MTVVDGEKLENFYPSRDGTNFKLKNLYHSPCCQDFPLYIKVGSALNSLVCSFSLSIIMSAK